MKRNLIVVLLVLGIVTGSGGAAVSEAREGKTKKAAQERVLLIGLIPEQNIFKQMERYEPLAAYLSSKVGIKIKLTVLPRYGNIIDNFIAARLDGAFFGSFTYALAHAKLGVQVLVRPESNDGSSTYHGLIFVRKDSGIRSARDMRGKRFAFVDKATTAGYLLPLEYFKKNAIKEYHTYFKETYFTGTHDDTIYDVLNKKADIGVAKNTVFARLAQEDPRIAAELTILEKSPDVPENGLAVRKGLDASLKAKLKEVFLTMHYDPQGKEVLQKFGARRFIATSNGDYQAVYAYAASIGLDLASYDYVNR
ncbi:MAG: phosphate/phosphite/phosphonate ABC transporter substrate-binding protein [Nitrospirota bacterium]